VKREKKAYSLQPTVRRKRRELNAEALRAQRIRGEEKDRSSEKRLGAF
jgi:hypothetical protein